jgi:hypothetical protein
MPSDHAASCNEPRSCSSWRLRRPGATPTKTADAAVSAEGVALADAAVSTEVGASATASIVAMEATSVAAHPSLVDLGPDGLHCLAERSPPETAAALCRASHTMLALMRTSAPHALDNCMLKDFSEMSLIESSGMWRVDGACFVLGISHLPSDLSSRYLRHLSFTYCVKLGDLAPLASLPNLCALKFASCPRVVDLTPLGACHRLERLSFSTCSRTLELAPLARCARLHTLELLFTSVASSTSELAPLAACPSLRNLRLTPWAQLHACKDRWPQMAEQCGLQHVHVTWHGACGHVAERHADADVERRNANVELS